MIVIPESDHSDSEDSAEDASTISAAATIIATKFPSQGDIGSVVTVVSNLREV